MQANKVVARFKDGSIVKGKTSDFFPNKETCHLETSSGEIKKIDMDCWWLRLSAILIRSELI